MKTIGVYAAGAQDKDVLRDFYLTFLGRRLLLSKSCSMDAEKSVTAKMKDLCGPQYSNKIEVWFAFLAPIFVPRPRVLHLRPTRCALFFEQTMITDFLTTSETSAVRNLFLGGGKRENAMF